MIQKLSLVWGRVANPTPKSSIKGEYKLESIVLFPNSDCLRDSYNEKAQHFCNDIFFSRNLFRRILLSYFSPSSFFAISKIISCVKISPYRHPHLTAQLIFAAWCRKYITHPIIRDLNINKEFPELKMCNNKVVRSK